MATARNPNLFVSHGSSDTQVAKTIAASLGDRFSVYLDAVDLRAGQNWQENGDAPFVSMSIAPAAPTLAAADVTGKVWVLLQADGSDAQTTRPAP